MAKGSGRFRNRKLGFKTRINVEVGVVIEDDPLDADLDIEDDKAHKGVETGVDKDEEGEVHLQQVIASAAAYVGGTPSRADKGKKREAAFIPTRSSQTIPEAEYRALYSTGYVDPISYIRFSDTVEDTQKGAIGYTMDEDDEDWLEDFNAQFLPGAKPRPATSSAADDVPETPGGSGRGGRKNNKHVASPSAAVAGPSSASSSAALDALPSPTAPLSEDDFEQLMELFEQTTERKAPMAHVNLSLIPRLDDMDEALLDPLTPELARLRPYAREVYVHWRARRIARGGKSVIPQLDVRPALSLSLSLPLSLSLALFASRKPDADSTTCSLRAVRRVERAEPVRLLQAARCQDGPQDAPVRSAEPRAPRPAAQRPVRRTRPPRQGAGARAHQARGAPARAGHLRPALRDARPQAALERARRRRGASHRASGEEAQARRAGRRVRPRHSLAPRLSLAPSPCACSSS